MTVGENRKQRYGIVFMANRYRSVRLTASGARKSHSQEFAIDKNHINGSQRWQGELLSQAQRHLRRYIGIPRANFLRFLNEC